MDLDFYPDFLAIFPEKVDPLNLESQNQVI